MELHIQKMLDNVSFRRKNIISLIMILIMCLGCCLAITCLVFKVPSISIVLAILVLCLEMIVMRQRRKEQGLTQTISSDLVITDENHRFFYQNRIFDLKSLIRVQYNQHVIIAVFEDYVLFLECDEDALNYFRTLCSQVVDISLTPKRRTTLSLLMILVIIACTIIFKLIAGILYCLLASTYLIDGNGLWIEFGILFIVMISIGLVYMIKKHAFIIYMIACIIVAILMILPLGRLDHLTYQGHELAYRIEDDRVSLYQNVRYLFGQQIAQIETDNVQRVGVFENVFYVAHDQTYDFYAIDKITQDINTLLNNQEHHAYGSLWMNVVIDQHKVFMNQEACEVSLVGNHVLYIQTEFHDYLISLDYNECEVYQLDMSYQRTLNLNQNLFEDEQDDEEVETESQQQETTESSQEEPLSESLQYDEEEKDQQRYQAYNDMLELDDLSSVKSNENLVKVHDNQDDIYQVIKAIDQEITRIDNSEGVILDVQILSMTISSQNDNQYGIYITKRIDSSVAESQTVEDVILMRKQNQDYVGTRFYSVRFMPATGRTDNEPYETRQTTEYLYRIEGHQVVENAW